MTYAGGSGKQDFDAGSQRNKVYRAAVESRHHHVPCPPQLREVTSYDELELDTLGDRKTVLFLIMSDTDDSFNFLISMCYTQLFNLLCEKADDVYGGRLPIHVRCLIFLNIGNLFARNMCFISQLFLRQIFLFSRCSECISQGGQIVNRHYRSPQ